MFFANHSRLVPPHTEGMESGLTTTPLAIEPRTSALQSCLLFHNIFILVVGHAISSSHAKKIVKADHGVSYQQGIVLKQACCRQFHFRVLNWLSERIWTTPVVLNSTNIPVSPRPPPWTHHRLLLPAYSLSLDVLKRIAIPQPPGPPIERPLELSRRQETAWRWRRLLLRSLDLTLDNYICLLRPRPWPCSTHTCQLSSTSSTLSLPSFVPYIASMVSSSVTVLAGLSAIMSTGIGGASADQHWRPGPGNHHNDPDGIETATYFVTVPVYPETTAPPVTVTQVVTQIVSVTQAISVPPPVESGSATITPLPSNTLSLSLTNTNSSLDLTSIAPTVCPGLDETILETIWTTLFNTITATVIA